MDRIPADDALLSTPTFFQLQEEERYRLARALMEGPGQILANTLLELEHALTLLEADPEAARVGLAALCTEVRSGVTQLKGFVAELQPPLLQEMGLGPSLRQYLENFGVQNKIDVECVGFDGLHERLPSTIETAVFRIVQEALANVQAHSGATRVRVQVKHLASQLEVTVEDNGRGFSRHEPTGVKRRQLGLVGMQDRAKLVGGHLQIFSEAGKGLRVVVTVPYHGQQEELAGGRNENGREIQNGREGAGSRKRGGAPSP